MITMVNALEAMLSRLEMTRFQQQVLLIIAAMLTVAAVTLVIVV